MCLIPSLLAADIFNRFIIRIMWQPDDSGELGESGESGEPGASGKSVIFRAMNGAMGRIIKAI